MPNWNQVLQEIQRHQIGHTQLAQGAVDLVRRDYLKKLSAHTGRNVIAYYSGFLSKPRIDESAISDEDKNGFMMALNGITKADLAKGLDLVIHTQGGSLAATESIVDYLRRKFGRDVRVIVPQIAMSAGTMIACSSKQILMARHSNLGPIDPYFGSWPAHGVIQEFKRACREVKRDPSKIAIWQPIIRQYQPGFLSKCENAKKWAAEFVHRQLVAVMFFGREGRREEIKGYRSKTQRFLGKPCA